jgi:AhpD family alkylhydroperoxidase
MTRLNPYVAAPEEMQRMIDFAIASGAYGLESSLNHLVKIRASQINGCAICLNMHAVEARKGGESEERIWLLDAWREAGVYTPREMAALAWTDALTRLSETRAPDEAYDAVKTEFSDEEIVKLTMMINTINAFNRIGVGFRTRPIGVTLAKAA